MKWIPFGPDGLICRCGCKRFEVERYPLGEKRYFIYVTCMECLKGQLIGECSDR